MTIAEEWGGIQGELDNEEKPMPVIDGLLALTALIHNLVVVTRNEVDYRLSGIEIINPFFFIVNPIVTSGWRPPVKFRLDLL